MKHQKYSCPTCGSPSTRRCRIAYEQSLNQGPTFDTQRAFASRVAPPSRPALWPTVACTAVAVGSAAHSLALAGCALVCGVAFWFNHRRLRPQYESDVTLYEKLWVCNDCAHIFKPE